MIGSAFAQEPPASYEKNCITCHGVDGKGNTAAGKKMNLPQLGSAEVQKLTDDQLYDTIANGTTHKQYPHAFARKGVSGLEIRDIIKFIRSLKTK
jgi:mono/diheme cytochrome c family protein